ncbi:hypothetical protein PENSPDRAFT_747902 [Peniophora sp. CONT]|nr:hypothetical protein PENSPDRAFT_747902 [Peniophora sp. CONT]
MSSKEKAPNVDRARLLIADDLKNVTNSAVKVAVNALEIASHMVQNVSYLAIISSVLTQFIKAHDQLNLFKSEWQYIEDLARQIHTIVDYVRRLYIGKDEEELPEGLAEPCMRLEKSIIRSLETLNDCITVRKGLINLARVLLRSEAVVNNVKQCRDDMKITLDMFSAELTVIKRNRRVTSDTERLVLLSAGRLAPPPATFRGRAREVAHVVELVLDQAPARIAILGSGGIGKTSLALAVLHHPEIQATFKDRRFFVSCHRVSSTEETVLELLTFFGTLEHDSSLIALSQDELVWYLRRLPNGMLCVDDWNADFTTNTNEDLLNELASLPNITLLVTMRGTEYPKHVAWTNPLLPPIPPLSLEDAMQIWDSICEANDEHALKLVQAVDGSPLAVTLLANCACNDSPKSLWQRWELNQRNPSQAGGARGSALPNIELSIKFALSGGDDLENAAVLLLSVICSLPQGLPEARIPDFIDAFKETIPNLRACISLLEHRSIVYKSEDGFLRALSPVARYTRSYHLLPDLVHAQLTELYLKIVEKNFEEDVSAKVAYARDHIGAEVGNILAVLLHCLEHETVKGPLERCFLAIASFTDFCGYIHYNGICIVLLDIAIDRAKNSAPSMIVSLLMSKVGDLWSSARFGEAPLAFTQIYAVCRSDSTMMETLGEGFILASLGDVYYRNGQYDDAKRVLHSALAFYENDAESLPGASTACQIQLGRVYLGLGMLDKAESFLLSAHRIYTTSEAESLSGPADSTCALGELHVATCEFEKAETELRFALPTLIRAGSEVAYADCLHSLGCLYMRTSRLESVKAWFEFALQLYTAAREGRGVADCLGSLGALHIHLNELDVAEEYLQFAMKLHSKAEYPRGKVTVLNSLGTLYHLLDRHEEACDVLNAAIQLAASMPYPFGEGDALFRLGSMHKNRGQLQQALSWFKRARELFERAQNLQRANSARAEIDEVAKLLQISLAV